MSGAKGHGLTDAQRHRRADAVVRLVKGGYDNWQIARAMSISVSTVSNDRRVRRRELEHAPQVVRADRRRPDPDPVDWMSEPPAPPPPPPYVLTSPVPRIRALLDYLRDTNARNRFAFNIDEAETAEDVSFIVGSQVDIAELIKYLQELQQIALSPEVQAEAKLASSRDDLAARGARPGAGAIPLPKPGQGELPGRVYAELWKYDYAGLKITDEVVEKLATRTGLRGGGSLYHSDSRVARIWQAVDEMRAAGLIK